MAELELRNTPSGSILEVRIIEPGQPGESGDPMNETKPETGASKRLDPITVDLCVDCIAVLESGKAITPPAEGEPLHLVSEHLLNLECMSVEFHFSWHPCGGCGSRLGGNRLTYSGF